MEKGKRLKPDYSITITIKNNYLLSAMRECGIETAAELSRVSGTRQMDIGKYLNLKLTPYGVRGGLRPSIDRIAKALKRLPEDLFPPQHIDNVLRKNKAVVLLDIVQVNNIIGYEHSQQHKLEYKESMDAIKGVIELLAPREKSVIRDRFGINGDEMTLEETAIRHGVSRERVRQIEKIATRRLRNFRHKLKEAKNVILGN